MYCPYCGNAEAESARLCSRCGLALTPPAAPAPNAEASASGSRVALYQAIVGPGNRDYYLRYFFRCDRTGKAGLSWHWPAFFATALWLIYRRMWLNALLYYALVYWLPANLLSFSLKMAQAIGGDSSNTATGFIYAACAILLAAAGWLAPAIYANALYYRHCQKKISEATAASPDRQRQLDELEAEGGVNTLPLAVIAVPVVVAIAGTQAAMALPPYYESLARTNLAQAATIGANAASAVSDYYYQHRQMPHDLLDAHFATPLPPSITSIEVGSRSGTVAITMAAPLTGKTLRYVPSFGPHNDIRWTCLSNDIEDRYLPRQCRKAHVIRADSESVH